MITQKRPPSDQLTLFQCVRQDTGSAEAHASKRHCHGIESDAGAIDIGDSDTSSPTGQSNYISIQSPSGPTTVIVNQRSALPEPSSTQREAAETPDDVAATPAHQPVRPVNVKFPVTLFSGKPRSFSPD